MSLEEEVNQSVSRAVSMAEAADAAAAAHEDDGPDSDELARLAPPAPDTVANGSVAPPRGDDGRPALPGRPGLTSRLGPPPAEPQLDPLDGHAPGLLPSDGPRGAMGRPAPAPSAPPLGASPARLGGPQDSGLHPPASGDTSPMVGLSDLFGDRDRDRDPGHGNGNGNGLIDPGDSDDRIRFMQ
jgi:hypothetical protein